MAIMNDINDIINHKIDISTINFFSGYSRSVLETYRSGTVNSKSFVGKVLLRIKWKFELTVHFKHEMLGK